MYIKLLDPNDKIAEGNGFDLQIYKVDEINRIKNIEDTLLVTKQRMEGEVEHWSLAEQDKESKIVFQGEYSNKVYEYSATFRYDLDSLNLNNYKLLVINTVAQTYFLEPTEAKIVVSITHEDETIHWGGAKVEKQLKSYSHWWPVKANFSFPTSSIPPNSKLTVFLWNSDFKKAYVDEFGISLSAIP
jgi:hypothetical protein